MCRPNQSSLEREVDTYNSNPQLKSLISIFEQHSMHSYNQQSNSQLTKPLRSEQEQLLIPQTHTEHHLTLGSFIKSVVYGSMDGVINTTIILLTGVASDTPVSQLFSICLSAIIAGALDMGLCDYVSSKSEMQFVELEEQRQKYQMVHFFKEEQQEMFEIYSKKGFSAQESERVVELLSTSPQAFLNVMMMEELGLVKHDDHSLPIKCGIATFIAFFTSSFISFFPYFITWLVNRSEVHPWPFVLGISAIQLASLGIAQAKIIGLRPWKSAIQFLLLGVVATVIGFVIGKILPR